jgi:hypothetical protein
VEDPFGILEPLVVPWWVTVLGACLVFAASLVGSLVGAWVDRRGKQQEEERLQLALALEADLRVAQAFSELMGRAHGRGPAVHFPEVANRLVDSDLGQSLLKAAPDPGDAPGQQLGGLLRNAAVVSTPVGEADMDVAAQLIAALATRYPLLRPAAEVGLRGRHAFAPVHDLEGWLAQWSARGSSPARAFSAGDSR